MKKITLILVAMLMLIPLVGMQAKQVGTWTIHPTFNASGSITNIIDTDKFVYYLTSGSLFCYDKETLENFQFNKDRGLNDVNISQIYYNYTKKYLVVVYSNSNVDFIKADGKVINIPDILNAITTSTKVINNVTFAPESDRCYLATDFGFVSINDKKMEIAGSRFYNTKLLSVAETGGYLLVLSSDGKLYWADAKSAVTTLGAFKVQDLSVTTTSSIYPMKDGYFLVKTGWLTKYKVSDDGVSVVNTVAQAAPNLVQERTDGSVSALFVTGKYFYTITPESNTKTSITNANLQSFMMSSYDGNSWWEANTTSGLREVSYDGATIKTDYLKVNASVVLHATWLTYNKELDKLYVSNMGPTKMLNEKVATTISTLDKDGVWTNVSLAGQSATYNPVFDPEDGTKYFISSRNSPFLTMVKDDKAVFKFTSANSPISDNNQIQFDDKGNLWSIIKTAPAKIYVLPREKQNQETFTKEDWYTVTDLSLASDWTARFLITKNGTKFFTQGGWGYPVCIFKGEYDQPQSLKEFKGFTDQDGKSYLWSYVYCFKEDLNGKVWIGTTNGIVEADPDNYMNDNFYVNRIKVPRNDGTGLADYLLDAKAVYSIAVDGANRKWIGTADSGVLLVSADGSTVLEQFTTENSPLPTNQIMSVECNPNTNSVYIGTLYGTYEYGSDAEAPVDGSMDETILAYPNPVRPDYTGLVTIKGLMDDTLLKVTDASGKVVANIQPNGGMATWDVCDSNGNRVNTGVYYVLASQSESGNSAKVKILVIK